MIIKSLQGALLSSLVATVSMTLIGCSSTPPKSLMDVQAGEKFVLKQPVTFPPGNVRQFIQYGQLSGGGFNHSDQSCRLELYSLSEERTTTLQPQRFLIKRVATGEEMIAQKERVIHFAQNTYAQIQNDAGPSVVLAFGENQRPETMDLVHLYLQSNDQPNVYRLTCSGALSNGNPFDAPRSHRPQRVDINRILGTVGSIES